MTSPSPAVKPINRTILSTPKANNYKWKDNHPRLKSVSIMWDKIITILQITHSRISMPNITAMKSQTIAASPMLKDIHKIKINSSTISPLTFTLITTNPPNQRLFLFLNSVQVKYKTAKNFPN